MTIEFPSGLTFYMKPGHEGKAIDDVKIVLQDKAVLEQTKRWMDKNSIFVNQSKNLREIKACVIEQSSIQPAVSKIDELIPQQLGQKRKAEKVADQKSTKKTKFKENQVCQGIEDKGVEYLLQLDVKTFKKSFPLILHYFQMGVLTEENLSAYIQNKDYTPDKKKRESFDFYTELTIRMDAIKPILDNCTEPQLFFLFAIPGTSRSILGKKKAIGNKGVHLNDTPRFEKIYPYLEKLSPEHFEHVILLAKPTELTFNDYKHSLPDYDFRMYGFLPFLIRQDYQKALNIFNRLSSEQKVKIFSAYGILHPNNLKLCHHYREAFTPEQITNLFNPLVLGFIGYQTITYQNQIQDLLNQLPIPDLMIVLGRKSQTLHNTALHNPFNWSFLAKFLEKLDDKSLFQLCFLTKNTQNISSFMTPSVYINRLSEKKVISQNLVLTILTNFAKNADKIDIEKLGSNLKEPLCYQMREIGRMMQILYRDILLPLRDYAAVKKDPTLKGTQDYYFYKKVMDGLAKWTRIDTKLINVAKMQEIIGKKFTLKD